MAKHKAFLENFEARRPNEEVFYLSFTARELAAVLAYLENEDVPTAEQIRQFEINLSLGDLFRYIGKPELYLELLALGVVEFWKREAVRKKSKGASVKVSG